MDSKNSEKILIEVKKSGENIAISMDCSPSELVGAIQGLLIELVKASDGELEHNQVLDDLKIIEEN
jgi:hypothetical protein